MMGEYIPAHIRRKRKEATLLELENADLRRRLSTMRRALESAERQLKGVMEREGLVKMAFQQVESALHSTAPDRLHSAYRNLREILAQEASRDYNKNSLYVGDRRYVREQNDADA